jgi:hypothetical protein
MGYDASTWDSVLEEAATSAGLDKDILRAIARQENVASDHNNPLGLSTDSGVKTFSTGSDAVAAIYRQARLLTDPNGPYHEFARTRSINDLARVYSPVGAANDVYGTNSSEGSGIARELAKLKGQPGLYQNEVDTANSGSSLLEQYRRSYPEQSDTSDADVLSMLRDQMAPGMDLKKFNWAAQTPNGFSEIKAFTDTPVFQYRQALGEEAKDLNDEQLSKKLYDTGVESGYVNPKIEKFDDFKERFLPDNSWQGIAGRTIHHIDNIVQETVRQVGPQTEQLGWRLLGGLHQISADFADKPPEDDPARAQEIEQFKKTNQELAMKADVMVAASQQKNQPEIPAEQAKIAQTIAQMPGQMALSLFPGIREAGNYTQLFKGNYDQIKQDHPDWAEDKVADRARQAADQQFPAQEILSLLMVKGGPLVTKAIANKVLAAGAHVGVVTGVGGLTFTANQVIQNIQNDKPPLTGVGEAFESGAIMGFTGSALTSGSSLLVSTLKRTFWATPQIRKAMGVTEGLVTQNAEDSLALLNGEGKGKVESTLQTNAIDMLLGGVKLLTDVPPDQAETSPVVEAFRKAQEARESGNLDDAQKFIDQALALATPTQRDIINQHVAATLAAVTNTPLKLPAPKKGEDGWTTLMAGQSTAEIPDGAEIRTNTLTGLTEYRVKPQKVSDQPIIDYFGLNAPKEQVNEASAITQEEHGFPSGSIQTRPDGKADLYLENGVKMTFPDVEDAIQARKTIRGARARKWEARSSGETATPPEVKEPKTELEQQLEASLQAQEAGVEAQQPPPPEATQQPGQPEALVHEQPDLRRQAETYVLGNFSAIEREMFDKGMPAMRETFENRVRNEMRGDVHFNSKTGNWEVWRAGERVYSGLEKVARQLTRKPTLGQGVREQMAATDEALGFIYNPFAAMRSAKRWAGENFPGWKATEDAMNRMLNPGRRGGVDPATGFHIGHQVEQIVRQFNAGVLQNIVARVRELAERANLNSVFEGAAVSERREAWFNKEPDGQLRQWIIRWARDGTTGNATADQFMRFNEAVRKFYNKLAYKSEVTNSWLAKQFAQNFKDPKASREWFTQQIAHNPTEIPTLEKAIAENPDLEPKSLNPERLMLSHVETIVRGIDELQMLKRLEDVGYLGLKEPRQKIGEFRERSVLEPPSPATHPASWTDEFKDAPNGKTYVMSSAAAEVLRNQFNPSMLQDSLGAMPAKWFTVLKASLGAKLAWSLFHMYHEAYVTSSEAQNEHIMRAAKGLLEPGDTRAFLRDVSEGPLSVGLAAVRMIPGIGGKLEPLLRQALPAQKDYANLLDVLNGKGLASGLSRADHINFNDLYSMGLVTKPHFERVAQWQRWIKDNPNLKGAGEVGNMIYRLLTNADFQQYYFGEMLPALKIKAALRRRDTVFRYYDRKGINLRDPANAAIWREEAGKINRDIEARFGEMNYDNLLWDKTIKSLGKVMPLSLGWSLGMLRVHGDAIQDFSDNVVNLDRIKEGIYKNPEFVTNRMLYAMNYWGLTAVGNLALASVMGGGVAALFDYKNLFYPKIGTKDNGEDDRIRPPFWSTESRNLIEGAIKEGGGVLGLGGTISEIQRYYANRLTPGAASFWQLINNKDYRNRKIMDDSDPLPMKMWDAVKFLFNEAFMPISVQGATQAHSMETWQGRVFHQLGFGPAPAWANRSDFENLVIYKAQERHPQGVIGHAESNESDARIDFINALQTKDPDKIDAARQAYIAAGATPRKLQEAQKVLITGHGKINSGLNAFHGLGGDYQLQVELLEQAPKEVFADYFRLASTAAKQLWIKEHGPLTAEQTAPATAQ